MCLKPLLVQRCGHCTDESKKKMCKYNDLLFNLCYQLRDWQTADLFLMWGQAICEQFSLFSLRI